MHDGDVIPTVTVLSHIEQRARLERYCPEALPAAIVGGDPCFDRILASLPLRETYRSAFGLRSGQRLVMVSSTWGPRSLFGNDPELVLRLARQLSLDEYRIVVALHPNIWFGHSPWQVRMWLKECHRSGVTVLPPVESWRAALVAADVTIGDHGSCSFYSAAIGTPLLLASWPEQDVDPASPIAALLSVAPRLDARRDLASQLDAVVASHRTDTYADITSKTTSCPGSAAAVLRESIYGMLGLSEPVAPADSTAVPLPQQRLTGAQAQLVDVHLDGAEASIRRFPAEALRNARHLGLAAPVVVTSTYEPDRRWLERAEAVIHDGPCPEPDLWIDATLRALPGSVLAACRTAESQWRVGDSGGDKVVFAGPDDLAAVFAALAHAWLLGGRRLPALPPRIRLALGRTGAHSEVVIRPVH